MQKHVNLVDLVKSFPTSIFLLNLASIQKRTSPIKFAHLAEKSEKGSISNLSTKVRDGNGREHGRGVADGGCIAKAAHIGELPKAARSCSLREPEGILAKCRFPWKATTQGRVGIPQDTPE